MVEAIDHTIGYIGLGLALGTFICMLFLQKKIFRLESEITNLKLDILKYFWNNSKNNSKNDIDIEI